MNKKTKQPIERFNAAADVGLTAEQVAQRVSAKQTNKVKKVVGKSYLQIFVGNIFTFFNLLGFIVFILMLICQAFTNMLFIVIILANTVIGIFQEIRSKRAVEKLSIVSEPTATVMRGGNQTTVATKDIVLDDVVLYGAGKQICCDSVVLVGEVEVDEAMLTGESVPVKKTVGDTLFSGSYVISGNCTARCDKVGKDNYIEQLSSKVKKSKMPASELMKGIRGIIKVISIIIFPLGIATFLCSEQMQTLFGAEVNLWVGYFAGTNVNIDGVVQNVTEMVNKAIEAASGAMIGMVPSGMVLLTSVALAVSALKLAKKKVLVRELPCIEMLARVDTLCLDKTGTITDGTMTVEEVINVGSGKWDVATLVASVVDATGDQNSTAVALKQHFESAPKVCSSVALPFSSARKYSAATLDGIGTVAIGAAEFLFDKTTVSQLDEQINELLAKGLRVIAVGVTKEQIVDGAVSGLTPIAIITLQDTIRPDATEIIGWFKGNNVAVKVISGDNPIAVSVIAGKVGVENAHKYVSLDGMTEEQVALAANEYTVFGRVTPEQKAILVRSMKKAGKTVAMTGDGVNDILAMRESDCAISVGCGSDAAKTVANLVLQDNKFSSMPRVVAEGRQVVNNIQNSSSLFLMKTSMVVLTTLLCLILQQTYPFQAKHLYALEFFVIGIPSFLLALKTNHNLITGKFITNTLVRTLPSGIAMFLSTAMSYAFANLLSVGGDQLTTVAMFSMTATGVVALWILLFPFGKVNVGIGALGTVGTAACFLVLPWALNLVAKLFGESNPTPMFVAIPSNAIWFVVANVVVMGGITVCLKVALHYAQKAASNRKAQKQN